MQRDMSGFLSRYTEYSMCTKADYILLHPLQLWQAWFFMQRLGLCLAQCSFYAETWIMFWDSAVFYAETWIMFGTVQFLCGDSDYILCNAVFMRRLGLFSAQCSFYADTQIIFDTVQFLCGDSDCFRCSAVFMRRLGLFSAQCSF